MIVSPDDPTLIEIMAEAAYEAWKPHRHMPTWSDTHEAWKSASRKEIAAALRGAYSVGYRVERP